MISATPSFPATAIGFGVESAVVNVGFEGYTPWIWLMSAGLMGDARKRRVMRLLCGGDIEWL
jgi:hypothetical protein